jgi:hypothetical protein
MCTYTFIGDFAAEDFDAEDFWVSAELEDPVDTLIRLIASLIRVTKDNGDFARLVVTEGNYDREILKEYDGQVTVSTLDGFDQTIKDGRLQREVNLLKCSVFSVDKSAPGSDAGRVMRKKIAEQIKTIIRENRNLPYQTTYNFYGLGYPAGDPHKAFDAAATTEIAPSSASWAELSVANYQKIWSSDDVRHSKSTTANNEYALMLFRFKIEPREQCVKSIGLSFEGYGTAPTGNGVALRVWNHVLGAWQSIAWNIVGTEETLSYTLTSDLSDLTDYITADGYIYLLARTRATSNGATPAVLNCDFVQCVIQVFGITHVDLQNFRNVLVTDLKPYLHSAEIAVKTWRFVTIS